MAPENAWQSARNILCIRLDSMGDVVMTTPAIRALKGGHPDRRITLLTSPSGAEVASLIPELDKVIEYEAPWMKATLLRSDSSPELQLASRLREACFDAAVIFTVFSQNPLPSALLAYLADIPLRLAHCRENPYQLLTHWVPEIDNIAAGNVRHEVRRQLDLVATIGCWTADERLSLQAPLEALRKIPVLLRRSGLDLACPWVVIHPGSTAASRRYPPEGFAEIANRLVSEHGMQVVFTGVRSERRLIQEIQSTMAAPSLSMVGRLNLGELAALLALAPLLISNNTGPVHIAAAVGTPVVDLYALTNPQHTPWGISHRLLYHDVPCKYCFKSICPQGHHDCLRLVSHESVVQAALELLAETSASKPITEASI